MTEEWKLVPGTDNKIEASSIGRIRSWENHPNCPKKPLPKLLHMSPRSNMPGRTYLCVVDKRIGRVPVHRLVASAFYGPILSGMEVDHIDRDPHNNNADNLRIVTRRQNHQNRRPCANTGMKNIHYRAVQKVYQVYVDRKYVGCYPNLTDAQKAAAEARERAGYVTQGTT